MAPDTDHPRLIEYRLVVIEPHSMRILTTDAAVDSLLPCQRIPAQVRPAKFLTEAIEQKYGLRTVQLACLPRTAELSYCAVHEIIHSPELVPRQLRFTTLDEISSREFVGEERAAVLKIINGEASEFGRFARIGWIDELIAKTGNRQNRSSWPFIRHVNQGIDFCLLSLTEPSGRRMWFKAVGKPNTREYGLSLELSRRFPKYLPRILFTIPEWNAWVMEEVQGIPLNDSRDLDQARAALTALAIMQRQMSNALASLLSLGAEAWTCARIAALSQRFFEEAQRAMQAQTSRKSRPLDARELDQLRRDVEYVIDEFMHTGIPETLLHGDIGHGNLLATANGPVFLDWAETYVGHPFLCAEHLLADLARSNPLFAHQQSALRSFYADYWRPYVEAGELERVTQFAPAIAAFACAVMLWKRCSSLPDPTLAWPMLRSNLRRTRRELDRIPEAVA